MFIIPSATLAGGRISQPSGVEALGAFASALRSEGATWIHLTDLDAALGRPNQWQHIHQTAGLKVAFGGGVRHLVQIQQLFDLGVERVVVSTQALRLPAWLSEAALLFPGRIVLAVDVEADHLRVEARSADGGDLDRLHAVAQMPLAAVLVTALAGQGARFDLGVIERVQARLPGVPLWAAGAQTEAEIGLLREAGVAAAVVVAPVKSLGPLLRP